jgi:subfamily B ATP-binding cassette protein MsbA
MSRKNKDTNLQIYLRLLAYLKPYKKHFALVIFFNFGFVIFSTLSMWMIAPVITTLFETKPETTVAVSDSLTATQPPIENSTSQLDVKRFNINSFLKEQVQYWLYRDTPYETLKLLCLFIVLSFALKNFFAFSEFYWVSYIEQRVIKTLREQVFEHILRQPISFFSARKTGAIISRITNDIDAVNVAFNRSFTKLIRDPVMIILYIFILFQISWQLSLIALVIFPLTTSAIQMIGRSLKRKSRRVQERISDITSNLQEVISGIKVVKAFGMEDYEAKKFAQRTTEHYKAVLRQVRLKRLASPLSETLGVSVMVAVLWYGGKMVLAGQLLTSEDFVRFIVLLFAMMEPIRSLSDLNTNLQIAVASGARIFEVLDTKPEIDDRPGAVVLQDFRKEIAYNDVVFRYHDSEENVLDGVNLHIFKNEKVALVGSSGAGKSTLVNLLPRFYDVTEGSITIDGIDIRNVTQQSLRKLMGIVTQEVILFNDTIANNIAYGQSGYDREALIKAAKLANAYDFIMEMPQGFDTVIGERGVRLSGGQRQRLSIARAILKNPPILIFDEATSSLDSESEYLIQEAVDNLMKDRTVLIIAHRLSSIIRSDKIVVLENGKVVDIGTHTELLASSERYKRLYELQYAGSSEDKATGN